MPTPEQVHIAIDSRMAAEFVDVPVLYSNQLDTVPSQGQTPYIKQNVRFNEAKQFELGRTTSKREYGALVFIIHVRVDTGTLARDRLYRRMVDLFRSQLVGGATFLNVQPLMEGRNENWFMSGHQIPFYFNSI